VVVVKGSLGGGGGTRPKRNSKKRTNPQKFLARTGGSKGWGQAARGKGIRQGRVRGSGFGRVKKGEKRSEKKLQGKGGDR